MVCSIYFNTFSGHILVYFIYFNFLTSNKKQIMKTQFYQKIDLRSKKQMVEFLTNHFRYDTMSNWNASTSYANKMKVWDVIPSELQDKVKEILEAIGILQTLLAQMTGGSAIADVPASFSFEKNLETGDVMIDVKYLQIVLNSASDTRLAASGVGSPGSETNYFGPLTKLAVIKFQDKYADEVLASWGLTSGTGFVGSTTRDKLNELLGK